MSSFVPTDSDFYVLLKTICNNLHELEQYVSDFGIDPHDPVVLTLRNEFLEQLKLELSAIKTLSELDAAISSGKYKQSWNVVSQRRKQLEDVTCKHCNLQLSSVVYKQKHEKTCIDRRTCSACNQTFDTIKLRCAHQNICANIERKCSKCKQTFSKANSLRTHEYKCLKRKLDNVQKYHCSRCPFTCHGRHILSRHITSQHGGNQPLQDFDADLPENEAFREEYNVNRNHILQQHRQERAGTVYNFPTSDLQDPDELERHLNEIFDSQSNAFRLNLSIGTILQNVNDGSFRYFIPYSNEFVFPVNEIISNRRDLQRVIRRLRNLDLRNYLNNLRPNSEFKPFYVTNLAFYTYNTNFPLGCSNVILPDKLKKSRSIKCMEFLNGNPFRDNLCFFRCLLFYQKKHLFARGVHALFKQWCDFKSIQPKIESFPGVMFHDLPRLEECFHTCINIFEMNCVSEEIKPKYLSRCRFKQTLNLNMYENHLSLITNFNAYAKKWSCEKCNRHFPNIQNMKRHQQKCSNNLKFKYRGGYAQRPQTIFEELKYFDINVPPILYDKFATYDFESILEKYNDNSSSKRVFTAKHKAVSVSICSNVEGFTEPKHFVNESEKRLVSDMIEYLTEISNFNAQKLENNLQHVFSQLDTLINKYSDEKIKEKNSRTDNVGFDNESETEGDESYESDFIDETDYPTNYPNPYLNPSVPNPNQKSSKNPNKYVRISLCKLKEKLIKFCRQLPVIGFNSSRYDTNLVKPQILKSLNMHKDKQAYVIKKCNAYLLISNEHFRFLDLSAFLAPGVSYAQFLKCYDIKEEKQFFPYEYLDCFDKLYETELPSIECFYSSLKKCNTLGQNNEEISKNYDNLKYFWSEKGMNSLADLLKFYNDHDVIGLTQGIEKMQEKFLSENVSIFKEAISISNYARQLLFRESNAVFPIFDKNSRDVYNTIKANIVGGPSIVFTRYIEAGVTAINNKFVTKSIQGLDANALYSWCLSQKLPVGPFVDRRAENGFRANISSKHIHQYAWIDKLSEDLGIEFKHKLNNGGKEIKIGPYYVDGFAVQNSGDKKGTVAEFMGCYFHYHEACQKLSNNPVTANRQLSAQNRTIKRREYLKNEGYDVIEIWECQYMTLERKHCTKFIEKYVPPHYKSHPFGEVSERQLENAIYNEEIFGLVECDIQLAPHYSRDGVAGKDFFQDFPPIFCNTDVSFDQIGSPMQQFIKDHDLSQKPRRQLISGTQAEKILLATPLLLWYLNNGFIITKIYRIIEFNGDECFKRLIENKTNERRMGDIDPSKSAIADTAKVILNSFYGSLIMDKTKHRTVSYIEGDRKLRLMINDPAFINCTDLGDEVFEVVKLKRNITIDTCNYLAHFILNYAKLHMIRFVYDVMHKYLYPRSWQYLEMDTDSIYAGYAGPTFESCVKIEEKEEFLDKIYNNCHKDHVDPSTGHWFPRKCCEKHKNYDRRSPGLMKLEHTGTKMICLSSKTYIISDNKSFKMSCKGVMKSSVTDPAKTFQNVLQQKQKVDVHNVGFRAHNNTMFTYTQRKTGFNWLYTKRKVLENGIDTKPLDIILTPWKAYNTYLINSDCILHPEFDCEIEYQGVEFLSARQLYLYLIFMEISKDNLANDVLNCQELYKLRIMKEPSNISPDVKISVMTEVFELVQNQLPEFNVVLRETRGREIMVSGIDNFWYTGVAYRYALVSDPAEYPGANHLGLILTKLLNELQI